MIRAPLQGLVSRPVRSSLTLVGGGLLLAFAATLLLTSLLARDAMDRWAEKYRPAVLLSATADEQARQNLKTTIRGWPDVEDLSLLSPEENLKEARQRLGAEAFDQLDLEAELFPRVLVVDVDAGAAGDVDIVSRLQALQTRSSVASVVYPSTQPSRWIQWVEGTVWSGWILLVVCLGLVVWQMTVLLGLICAAEGRERRLLERFGATTEQFRRSRFVRGGAVGAGIGVVAAAVTWGILSGVEGMLGPLFAGVIPVEQIAGRAAWLLVLGPALGLSAAVLAGRTESAGSTRDSAVHPGLTSVLTEE